MSTSTRYLSALDQLERAIAALRRRPQPKRKNKKSRRPPPAPVRRKATKRQVATAPTPRCNVAPAVTPPRTDAPVEQLVERVRAELPEVFGEPTPKTVLELYGPWDFGTPTGRVFVGLRREKPLERAAWRDAG